jgi:hypothetical protein
MRSREALARARSALAIRLQPIGRDLTGRRLLVRARRYGRAILAAILLLGILAMIIHWS